MKLTDIKSKIQEESNPRMQYSQAYMQAKNAIAKIAYILDRHTKSEDRSEDSLNKANYMSRVASQLQQILSSLETKNESVSEDCLTPGAEYHFEIEDGKVEADVTHKNIVVDTEAEAKQLEDSLHDALEKELSKFFKN